MDGSAEKREAAEKLKAMQWDVDLMMSLSHEQRRTIDAAVKALEENPFLDELRRVLPVGHPLK